VDGTGSESRPIAGLWCTR